MPDVTRRDVESFGYKAAESDREYNSLRDTHHGPQAGKLAAEHSQRFFLNFAALQQIESPRNQLEILYNIWGATDEGSVFGAALDRAMANLQFQHPDLPAAIGYTGPGAKMPQAFIDARERKNSMSQDPNDFSRMSSRSGGAFTTPSQLRAEHAAAMQSKSEAPTGTGTATEKTWNGNQRRAAMTPTL